MAKLNYLKPTGLKKQGKVSNWSNICTIYRENEMEALMVSTMLDTGM